MLAAEIWHWWIGVVLVVVAILAVLGLGRRLPEERHGQAVPEPPPAARRLTVAGVARAPSSATLLARCSFPPPGTAVACAFSGGADSTALLSLAVGRRAADVTAIHVDHGLRADVGGRGRRTPRALAADARRAVLRSSPSTSPPGPNLEARARDGPPGRPARRRAHRPHRRRPGRDDAHQPAARRRPRRAGGDGARTRPARSSPCAAPRPAACAPTSGSTRSTTRPTTTPASCATASATSCSR